MSLNFAGGSTDRVDFGSDASLDNMSEFTFMFWARWEVFGSLDFLFSKGASDDLALHFRFSGIALNEFAFDRARATTDLFVAQSNTGSHNLQTDTWYCVAATAHETNAPHIYSGSLTEIFAEYPYDSQITGSGAFTDDSGSNLIIGNNTGFTQATEGDIAFVQVWDRQLSLAECRANQFRMTPDVDTVAFSHLGYNGTGTQPDWSGNGNSGTVTGAAQSDHVPLGSQFGFDHNWAGAFTAPPSAATLLIMQQMNQFNGGSI